MAALPNPYASHPRFDDLAISVPAFAPLSVPSLGRELAPSLLTRFPTLLSVRKTSKGLPMIDFQDEKAIR